jgi:hypothetical protein
LKIELLFPLIAYVLVILLAFIDPNWAGMGYAILALENRINKPGKKKEADLVLQTEEQAQAVPSENS